MDTIDQYIADCAQLRIEIEAAAKKLRSFSGAAVPQRAVNDDGTISEVDVIGSALPPLPGVEGPRYDKIAYTAAGETIEWIDRAPYGGMRPEMVFRSREQVRAAANEIVEQLWWLYMREELFASQSGRNGADAVRPRTAADVSRYRRLASKYGFKKLKRLDVSDLRSRLSALAWVQGSSWPD